MPAAHAETVNSKATVVALKRSFMFESHFHSGHRRHSTSASYQSNNSKDNHRADRCTNQRAKEPSSYGNPELTEYPTAKHRSDYSDNHVAEQPKAVAAHDHAAKPTSDGADEQPNQQSFRCHCLIS